MDFAEYHKIHSLYLRDEKTHAIRPGEWARPEIGYLAGLEWEWTEKVDGTNIRIDAGGHVGGRTDGAQVPPRLLDGIRALDLGTRMRAVFPATAATLYGEGYGSGIQKGGGNYRKDPSFVLFDVLVGGRWWLSRADVEDVAVKLGLSVVPVILRGTIADAERVVSAGFTSTWGPFRAEGLVGRPAVPLFARDGSRVIAKCKTVDYEKLSRTHVGGASGFSFADKP